jgi:hypothetical protein
MGVDDDRRTMRLRVERAWRHHIVGLGMRVWVIPLRNRLSVGRGERSPIWLGMVVVLGVRMRVYRRVRLWRELVLKRMLAMSPALVERPGGRYHGRARSDGAFTAGAGR